MNYFLYLIIGTFSGTLSGLLGIGGGIIVVPALALLFQYNHTFPDPFIMHMAVGTSLASMIFTTLSSASVYHRHAFLVWPVFFRFIPGLCIGIITGTIIAKHLPSNKLSLLFSIFLFGIAIHLFFSKSKKQSLSTISKYPALPNGFILNFTAFFVGILSGFFGIGGGIIMIPCFLYFGLSIKESSGTSAICSIPLSIIGTLCMIATGWVMAKNVHTPFGSTGFVYWPAVALISFSSIFFAPIGAYLAFRSKAIVLKRILAILLILSAYHLGLEALNQR